MALGLKTVLRAQNLLWYWRSVCLSFCLGVVLLLAGCKLPQVSAESRLFLNLSASLVADYTLPKTDIDGKRVGGFSALAYNAQTDRISALVDDAIAPRVYTLKLPSPGADSGSSVPTIEAVTALQDPLKPDSSSSAATLDGEGLVLTRRGTLFVASEGNAKLNIPPRLSEFDAKGGTWRQDLLLPKQYWTLLPDGSLDLGVNQNQGFESLAINAEGDRLFAATQAPLQQDASHRYSRFLHYWIGEPEPILISEHLYPLDSLDPETTDEPDGGLRDLISIDNAGHFLALEQSHSKTTGDRTVLYQLATGVATDVSGIRTLPPTLKGIVPILKRPLLDLANLNLPLQNWQGLSLGPRLADGSRSLLLIGDNGTKPEVPTQLVMLRLGGQSS